MRHLRSAMTAPDAPERAVAAIERDPKVMLRLLSDGAAYPRPLQAVARFASAVSRYSRKEGQKGHRHRPPIP